MKILNQYIVYEHNQWQILYDCGKGNFFITDSGAFNQRDLRIIKISPTEAEKLIKEEKVYQ